MKDAYDAFTNMKGTLMTKTLTLLKKRIKRGKKKKKSSTIPSPLGILERLGLTIQIRNHKTQEGKKPIIRQQLEGRKGN